jgi:hypothetical protein
MHLFGVCTKMHKQTGPATVTYKYVRSFTEKKKRQVFGTGPFYRTAQLSYVFRRAVISGLTSDRIGIFIIERNVFDNKGDTRFH